MILFLHGMLGTGQHWTQLHTSLPRALQTDVLAPTLDFTRFDAAHCVDHCRRILPTDQPLVIVGNSLGCVVALGLHERANALVLTAAPFDFTNDPLRLRREGVDAYVDELYANDTEIAQYEQHRADAIRILSRLMANRQGIKRLRQMKHECLAILEDGSLSATQDKSTYVIGEDDHTTPMPAFQNSLQGVAPRASFKVLPGCKHAIPLEAPRALAKIIAGLDVFNL